MALPTQPFGVSNDEFDAIGVTEFPKAALLIQGAVSEHHHLLKPIEINIYRAIKLFM